MAGRMGALEIVFKRKELDLKELRTENKDFKALIEGKEKTNDKNDILTENEEDESKVESDTQCQQVEEVLLDQVVSFKFTKCDFMRKKMADLKIFDTIKHKEEINIERN